MIALVSSCFILFQGTPVTAAPNQFVIVSDTQNIDGVDRMTREIIALAPTFVVAVGDVPDCFEPRVNFFKRLREAGINVHIAMGNHDTKPKQLLRSSLPPYPFHEEVDPVLRYVVDNKYYYSFNRGGIHFVISDTSTANKAQEYKWLEDDLIHHVNNPKRHPTLVFMHYPSWMTRRDDGTGGPIYEVLAKHPDKHTVVAAFAGHTHKGKRYPTRDTLGIPLYTLYPSAPFGADLHTEYVIATVGEHEITFERKVVLEAGKSGDFAIDSVKGTFFSLEKEAGNEAKDAAAKREDEHAEETTADAKADRDRE